MKNIPLYHVEPIRDLKEMIEKSADTFGEKAAFLKKDVPGGPYIPVSYTQYKKDVDALGTALIRRGCKDERIAIIGENRYEWSVSYLAIVNGTGIVVPLDKELPENEIVTSLNRAEVSTIIFSPKLTEKVLACKDRVPTLKHLITMDRPEAAENGCSSVYDLIREGRNLLAEGDDSFTGASIDREAMQILLFTSGTTDLSKAVMLSHKNICENLMAMCAMTYIDDKDVFLSVLPIHHTYECTCGFLCPLYRGSTVAYCEGLRHITKNMEEGKITMMLVVPLILESMHKKVWDTIKKQGLEKKVKFALKLNSVLRAMGMDKSKKFFAKVHESFGGHMRLFISGAAAVDPHVSKNFRNFGILTIQGYGLTECAPIAALNRNCDFKDDAAGMAMPGTELEIENPDNNGIGEIIIKGPNVMLGYYEDEAATKQAIDSRGYFHTGDLGYLDKEKFVHITGRKKNVIVTKNGKNIFPEEVEYLLLKSPYIAEVVVYGENGEDGETIVKANIFPDYEKIKEDAAAGILQTDTPEAVIKGEIKSVNKQLVSYKAVKDFSLRDTEFVKTSTQKIKRYVEDNKADHEKQE
ncbi:MAG: AMP-dependent synthetase/ligase [Clostridia bacterium]